MRRLPLEHFEGDVGIEGRDPLVFSLVGLDVFRRGRRAVGEADGAEGEEREDGEFAVVDGESGRIDADKGGLPVGFLPGGFEDPDVGEVAVTLGEIESVADDEFIGNFETDKIGLEGDLAAAFFVEQYTNPETGGTHAAHHASDE